MNGESGGLGESVTVSLGGCGPEEDLEELHLCYDGKCVCGSEVGSKMEIRN